MSDRANDLGRRTVRDLTVQAWRELGMTTVFANPGSTEISLLAHLPADIELMLALHEGSVVGMATGYALAREQPALVVLHTTAGLGNAVGALATARANRAPLVVIVGQQDRRHLAMEPFLAGRLRGLAGDYPVWQDEPVRAADVPGAIRRAWFEARDRRGPALIIVPMDDWSAEIDESLPVAAPQDLRVARAVKTAELHELIELVAQAQRPCLVVGAGADSSRCWVALTRLAARLACPVWQEPFGSRAGFPQDHPQFMGHLPADRRGLRKALAGHDLVLCVGAPAFRQYPFDEGPFVAAGTRIAVITDDPEEARRSPATAAVLADPAAAIKRLAKAIRPRGRADFESPRRIYPAAPAAGTVMAPGHVFAALARRLPPATTVVEETPSSRPELHALLPARTPLGFLSAAMGGLGFAMPAGIGLRMADPSRPVVVIVGDGSSMYAVQSLWSAAHYGVGVVFVVLCNGRYAIMDRLASEADDDSPPWPAFEELDVAAVAEGLGCRAVRIDDHDHLVGELDSLMPALGELTQPVLLSVRVSAGSTRHLPLEGREGTSMTEHKGALLDPSQWDGQIYASNGWVSGAGKIPVREKATGRALGIIGEADGAQVSQAAAAAAQAQRSWAAAAYEQRAAVLRAAGQAWERHAAEIEDWLVREAGSIPPKAALETRVAAQECFEAAALPSLPNGVSLPSAEPRWSFARRRPVGVVSVIAPFNFPLVLAIRSVAPALALGNSVLLKPDPRTTVSGGVSIVRIFEEAGLPPGLLQLLPGGSDVGSGMITAPEVRVVSFTGSTAAGRAVGALAAEHLTRAHLELGGNNALIVLPGADLALAASAGAFGSFMHQGQICMTTGRHLVHESLYEAYVEALAEKARQLPVGDPAAGSVALGPIIDAGQLAKIDKIVSDSVAQGARLAAGGTYVGLFYRPTVLADITTAMPAYTSEIFGPVAPVVPFTDIDEAIALAQDNDYGLSLGILGDVGTAMRIADAVPSGIVHINEQTVSDEANVPFGGVGASGTGSRFGGPDANIEAFTETQWMTVRSTIAPYPF